MGWAGLTSRGDSATTVGERVVVTPLQPGDVAEGGKEPRLVRCAAATAAERYRLFEQGSRRWPTSLGQRNERSLCKRPLQPLDVAEPAQQGNQLVSHQGEGRDVAEVGVRRLQPVQARGEGHVVACFAAACHSGRAQLERPYEIHVVG